MALNIIAPSVTASAPGAAETVTWESLYGVLSQPHPLLKRISNLPGSAVLWRYIKSSHQNDPARTFLELLLVIFVVYTWLKSRTRGDKSNFVKLTEKVSIACITRITATQSGEVKLILYLPFRFCRLRPSRHAGDRGPRGRVAARAIDVQRRRCFKFTDRTSHSWTSIVAP